MILWIYATLIIIREMLILNSPSLAALYFLGERMICFYLLVFSCGLNVSLHAHTQTNTCSFKHFWLRKQAARSAWLFTRMNQWERERTKVKCMRGRSLPLTSVCFLEAGRERTGEWKRERIGWGWLEQRRTQWCQHFVTLSDNTHTHTQTHRWVKSKHNRFAKGHATI